MNPVTGTAAFSIPIFTSPGRSDFGPKLSLSYDSGSGNGPFGLGWHLGIPSITRKTSKGLPLYRDDEDSDIFLLSDAEDLVPELIEDCGEWVHKRHQYQIAGEHYEVRRYRPRIEGLFARIEKWRSLKDCQTHWRVISRDNITSLYGRTPNARISDPDKPVNTFQWMLERTWDDKGNTVSYEYRREELPPCDHRLSERHRKPAQTNLYPARILYGNRTPYYVDPATHDIPLSLVPSDWLFEVRFDYAKDFDPATGPSQDWSVRQDSFSTYNATFEVRTWRLCHRVLMYHRFDELELNPYLVRSTDLSYDESPFVTHLTSATQTGYLWKEGRYHSKSYPPVEFSYEQLKAFHTEIQEVDPASLRNLPVGLENGYQFLDLDGEGIAGIFSDQGGGWFFKRNLGEVRGSTPPSVRPPTIIEETPLQFAPVANLPYRPSLGTQGRYQFLDLAGDGQIDVALLDQPSGFYERTQDESWERFRTFQSLPNLDFNSPNVRFVDLTGDGLADILITEDQAFVWHESLGEDGFGPGQRVHQALYEERGPSVVFAEPQQTIFLADMSGDGLNDLVRIRNGEVSYWPNLGYGRFGAKVTMENSPWFDHPEQFDPRRIRLNDVDGTGPTDLLYVRPDRVSIWRSESGNGWSSEETISIPPFHSHSSIQVADILGQGTACLVWSSRLPGEAGASLRYIDLIGKRKPHLLRKMENNLGAETVVHYAPSTKFYLADRIAGRPWVTRLSFPVHVCEKVETFDRISRNYFATRYAYHHGYFDGVEREFRGFGMVEQWDTETMAALSASDEFPVGDNIDPASHVPPVLTKTWFHTGAYLDRERISNYFAGIGDQPGEYFREPGLTDREAHDQLLEDTILPCDLSPDLWGEACRALKGSVLRQEIYALDGSAKEPYPYTVSERNYAVRLVQPRGSRYAVFQTNERESLSYQYERNPADPRVAHALTLQLDNYGNVLKSAAIGYGRRKPDPTLEERDQLVVCSQNRIRPQKDGLRDEVSVAMASW